MSQDSLAIVGEVPTGGVLVDGLGIGDVGNVVLRDRKHLSQDGLIIVVMAIDRDTAARWYPARTSSAAACVYVRENEDIIECSRELARNIVLNYGQVDGSEWQNMKNRIKDELHRYIFDKIKRNPMICRSLWRYDACVFVGKARLRRAFSTRRRRKKGHTAMNQHQAAIWGAGGIAQTHAMALRGRRHPHPHGREPQRGGGKGLREQWGIPSGPRTRRRCWTRPSARSTPAPAGASL